MCNEPLPYPFENPKTELINSPTIALLHLLLPHFLLPSLPFPTLAMGPNSTILPGPKYYNHHDYSLLQ